MALCASRCTIRLDGVSDFCCRRSVLLSTLWAGAVGVLWVGEPILVFNTAMSRSLRRTA